MRIEAEYLPDDIPVLKGMIVDFEKENNILREQLRLLRSKMFGRKSEKASEYQQELLFDEPESGKAETATETPVMEVPSHIRKKPGRKPLPAGLPRVEVVHDISEEEKKCACGCEKTVIGREVSEQLDIVPARIQVIKHIRLKYACKSCDGTEGSVVTIATVPEQIIPRSIATPGLLAHIFTAKFVDAVPFYRQEKQFERLGIELDRMNMSSWAMRVSEQCEPLMDMLKKEILSGPLINIDETTVQVMGEENRANTSKSYMWVFRGGPPGKTGLIFQYHPTRSGDVPKEFLGQYKGCVQTDGYAGYDFLDNTPDIVHAGCWAHARRKFVEVTQASKTTGSADVALSYIQKLYAIERITGNLSFDEIVKTRQEKSLPILNEFKAWLDKKAIQTPPSGLLGKAVHYALNQWKRLVRYTDHGFITPDNNLAENAIRPFVLGRKNWLFSGNPKGAHASACLYSLIEAAKANGLEPYHYLRHLFENLPHAYTAEEYKALLPQFVTI